MDPLSCPTSVSSSLPTPIFFFIVLPTTWNYISFGSLLTLSTPPPLLKSKSLEGPTPLSVIRAVPSSPHALVQKRLLASAWMLPPPWAVILQTYTAG